MIWRETHHWADLFSYKLWSIIKLALFFYTFSSRVFGAKECSQRLLDMWNRFLWRFCIVLNGASFYSTSFQLRDIAARSRQVAGVVEHRCIFQVMCVCMIVGKVEDCRSVGLHFCRLLRWGASERWPWPSEMISADYEIHSCDTFVPDHYACMASVYVIPFYQ